MPAKKTTKTTTKGATMSKRRARKTSAAVEQPADPTPVEVVVEQPTDESQPVETVAIVPAGETAPTTGFRFTVMQPDLVAHLPCLCKFLGSYHPILSEILVEARKESVTLTASNLSAYYQVTLFADVDVEGTYTLPATLLKDLIPKLPAEPLTFTQGGESGNEVVITASSGDHKVFGMLPEEFPELPIVKGKSIELDCKRLQQAIAHVSYAASDDESKQVLTGVYFTFAGDALEAVAVDGHRLSQYKDGSGKGEEWNVNVPAKWIGTVSQLNDGDRCIITVGGEGNYVEFKVRNAKLVSRTLEGQYPNYSQLIPRSFNYEVTIDRVALLKSCERVAVFVKNKNIIRMAFSKTGLSVFVPGTAVGEGNEKIPVEWNYEKDFVVAFNGTYILDVLKIIATSKVAFRANTPTSPVILVPVNENEKPLDFSFSALIMPVQYR